MITSRIIIDIFLDITWINRVLIQNSGLAYFTDPWLNIFKNRIPPIIPKIYFGVDVPELLAALSLETIKRLIQNLYQLKLMPNQVVNN